MTSKPTAVQDYNISINESSFKGAFSIPMGKLTPTNSPFRNAGPVEGTRFPSKMPMAIASIIQITRKRSRSDNPLRGGTSCLVGSIVPSELIC